MSAPLIIAQPSHEPTSLMARLKEDTRQAHERLDHLPYHKALFSQELSLSRYAQQLVCWHEFVFALELTLEDSRCVALRGLNALRTPKSPWLAADLEALRRRLGRLPSPTSSARMYARYLDTLVIEESFELLGHLYVMEGSALGGMVLKKQLAAQLPELDDEQGLRFYSGHGRATMPIWGEFKAAVDALELSQRQQDQVIQEANRAFAFVEDIIQEL